ncbi:MAG: isoprenylcysteine carboxylmethyltransferase family protein [Longimicrobiales bacterium]
MALKDEMERSGERLFRWRNYPPALFFGVILWGVRGMRDSSGTAIPEGMWELICIAVSVLGLVLRIWVVGTAAPSTSGGNRRGQKAGSVNTTGAYSMVRHPLYLGALLSWTGVALFPRSPGILIITWLLFWVYYERIMIAEESFLERKFGPAYTEWANGTPALFPRFRNYVTPQRPFSLRRALRREYSSWLAAATPLFAVKVYSDYVLSGTWRVDRVWLIGFAGVCILAGVIRSLKHYTKLLDSNREPV